MDEKYLWSRDKTIALINMIEGFPELWQIKSQVYRDRIKKQQTLKYIAEKFSTTEKEIQRKLHNLRTQANQEWNKMKKKSSGQGTDEIYKSSWEYFDSLKFLLDQYITSGTEDNLVDVEESSTSTSCSEATVTTPKSVDKKCSTKKRSCIENDAIDKAITELYKQSDEYDIFGEYVACEIRSLQSDHNRRKLKRIIQKAVLDMSEIDDNERSSAHSTHSHLSTTSQHSEAGSKSLYSYSLASSSAIQPVEPYSQTSDVLAITNSSTPYTHTSSSAAQHFHDLQHSSEPHSIQELSLRRYIQEYETDT